MPVDRISLNFSRLSFVCACLIVALHVDAVPIQGVVGSVVQRVVAVLYRAAVPAFFLMSGYWLVGHVEEKGWWKAALRKRIVTLGVPYLFFITLSLVVLMALKEAGRRFGLPVSEGYSLSFILDQYGWDLRCGTGANMWYVRCLFIFVLLSGAVVPFLRRWYWAGIALIVGVAILPSYIRSPWLGGFWYFGFNAVGFASFVCGMMLRMGRSDRVLDTVFRWGWLGLPIGVGLGLMSSNPLMVPVVQAFVIAGLTSFSAHIRIPASWGSLSFPIYAQHGLVWLILVYGIRLLHLDPYLSTLVGYLLAVAVTLLASIALTVLVRSLVPRVAKVVYGGR